MSKRLIAWIVLILGLIISFYVSGAYYIDSVGSVLAELDGSIIGMIAVFMPFVVLFYVANKIPKTEVLIGAFILLASSLAYILVAIVSPDPQLGIAYLLYVCPLQLIGLALVSTISFLKKRNI